MQLLAFLWVAPLAFCVPFALLSLWSWISMAVSWSPCCMTLFIVWYNLLPLANPFTFLDAMTEAHCGGPGWGSMPSSCTSLTHTLTVTTARGAAGCSNTPPHLHLRHLRFCILCQACAGKKVRARSLWAACACRFASSMLRRGGGCWLARASRRMRLPSSHGRLPCTTRVLCCRSVCGCAAHA